MNETSPVQMMTLEAVAARINVCTKSVRQWVEAGTFPSPYRINRRTLRWDSEEVEQFIRSRPRTGAGE